MLKQPLVSVIVPVFNHQEFIGQAIESVLNQTFTDFEIIVIDDGSTDQTRKIVQRYRPTVRYIYKNHCGAPNALNVGISKVKGSFICWLSSDDQFLPNKLQIQVNAFQANPSLGMIYTDWYEVDTYGNIIKLRRSRTLASHKEAALALLKHNCINGSTVMLKTECFQRAGGFREDYLQGHDHEMWLRLCRYYLFGYIPEPLVFYRKHHKNLSLQPNPLHAFQHKQMYRETRAFFGFPG